MPSTSNLVCDGHLIPSVSTFATHDIMPAVPCHSCVNPRRSIPFSPPAPRSCEQKQKAKEQAKICISKAIAQSVVPWSSSVKSVVTVADSSRSMMVTYETPRTLRDQQFRGPHLYFPSLCTRRSSVYLHSRSHPLRPLNFSVLHKTKQEDMSDALDALAPRVSV